MRTLNKHMRELGVKWDFFVTHELGDGAKLAKQAAEAGADIVASFGGDGTVMDVATGLEGTDIPLMILPGGTGNLVAAELALPKDIDGAIERMCRETVETRKVDLGQMGGQKFLLRVGCGFETHALAEASREMKDQFGIWAYAFAAGKALVDVKATHYELELDGKETYSGSAIACFVANAGRIGIGDLTLSPRIDMDDGKLDVIIIEKAGAEGIFSLVRMMMGDDESGDGPNVDASHLVRHWQVEKVKIKTDPALEMQADGDLCGETPQEIEVLPHALRVVV